MSIALTAYATGFVIGIAIWLLAYWCGRIDARHVSYLDGYEHGLIEAQERAKEAGQ